ncbi:M48 family metallopeptidase [Streptomyces sp. ICBB 8177]|uniref:M48 metallopeptidase family protein n=1 Tax=Streptomyces sp. ICBB 8177 TaxID=563922 RepID=UPI000D6827A9|nr:M48 family metallopeptidase [Streptomyces sp. ICBB 8177]PWI44010.1 metal-dependent hydrolase [Streptomyces sp. ICBB 8177]
MPVTPADPARPTGAAPTAAPTTEPATALAPTTEPATGPAPTGAAPAPTTAPADTAPATGPGDAASLIEVRRSPRRRRTVSAYREGERTIVLLPARMSAAEEKRWVAVMLERLAAKERRQPRGDDALAERAARLSAQYLDGRARPDTVRWVTNQNSRWGSCTPAEGSIRLSHRLQGMPDHVIDYVLLHELAHLLVPGHGPDFWALLAAYPRTERARGYLEGVAAAAHLPGLSEG